MGISGSIDFKSLAPSLYRSYEFNRLSVIFYMCLFVSTDGSKVWGRLSNIFSAGLISLSGVLFKLSNQRYGSSPVSSALRSTCFTV